MGASSAGDGAPLALTMGDPAGIGLEIALKAWTVRSARGLPSFVLYADPALVTARARVLGIAVAVAVVDAPTEALARVDRALPVVAVPLAAPSVAGQPDTANAAATIASIERATYDVAMGHASALVTNPIAKSVLYSAGFTHPGHTEFLAHLSARITERKPMRPVMLLASSELRVVPLTIHVPLTDVPALISHDLIVDTATIVESALRRDFGIARPRIAIAGLNPHAGENGAIGREDRDVIAPAVAALAARGLLVTGPHSADTLFHAEARNRYDAAIAMYHDQALIPIKTLAFDTGVNVTLGLPFVRTSPDHGTAFDIAALGTASPESLIQALILASRMAKQRAESFRVPAS